MFKNTLGELSYSIYDRFDKKIGAEAGFDAVQSTFFLSTIRNEFRTGTEQLILFSTSGRAETKLFDLNIPRIRCGVKMLIALHEVADRLSSSDFAELLSMLSGRITTGSALIFDSKNGESRFISLLESSGFLLYEYKKAAKENFFLAVKRA